MTFNIGDRVIGICNDRDNNDAIVNNIGTIIHITHCSYLIAWDNPGSRFHNGGGLVDQYCAWWIEKDDHCIELYDGTVQSGSIVERRCRRLWKQSKWVQKHPEFSY